jgi:hypothetical protein
MCTALLFLLITLPGRKTVGRLAGSIGLISSGQRQSTAIQQDSRAYGPNDATSTAVPHPRPANLSGTGRTAAAEPAGAFPDVQSSTVSQLPQVTPTGDQVTPSGVESPLVWRGVGGHRKAVLKASAFVPQVRHV